MTCIEILILIFRRKGGILIQIGEKIKLDWIFAKIFDLSKRTWSVSVGYRRLILKILKQFDEWNTFSGETVSNLNNI